MSRSQRAQCWHSAACVGGGVLLASAFALLGWGAAALIVLLVGVVLAVVVAPRRSTPTVQHWEAQDRLVRDGRVIVYWRPGCFFCTRLRLRLGAAGRQATWVDIWSDPEAAAFVRDVNGGAESVPTVILSDGEAVTKPDPALVRAHLERLVTAA